MRRTERRHGTPCRGDALGGLLPQPLNFVLFSLWLSIIVFKIILPQTASATLDTGIPHALSRSRARCWVFGGLECFEYYYTQNLMRHYDDARN